MLKLKVALLVAALAIAANGVTFRPFVNGFLTSATPIVSNEFVGAQWPCWKSDETCFAGFSAWERELRTGP